MPSIRSELDHSEYERRKVIEVIKLFEEHGTAQLEGETDCPDSWRRSPKIEIPIEVCPMPKGDPTPRRLSHKSIHGK